MNDKKFQIIVHVTDERYFSELENSLLGIAIPEGFAVEVRKVAGDKYDSYNSAMRTSDAKYKIYLDEHANIANKNFLVELIDIFRADEKIGMVGVSGAIELSTHGVALNSVKRGGKIFSGEQNPRFKNWGNSGDAQIIDGFFIATQYDLPWREDLFSDDYFGGQAQCVEFKRAGYRVVIAKQKVLWIWYQKENFTFDEPSRQKFLAEYSTDLFPLVTVIIPTFNRPKYFREALDSALAQTYKNIEIVISDNSTEDDTEILMRDYHDARIKYFRHKNFNADDNWNFARDYNNPAAEYVNWLLDDDLFYPTKIEKMIEVYRNNPDVSLVTSSRDIIDANGNIMDDTQGLFEQDIKIAGEEAGKLLFLMPNFLMANYIGEPTTVLIRKKFLRGGDLCWHEDERGFFSLVDVSTWLQLLTRGNLFRLKECLSGFRRHGRQATYFNDIYAITPASWIKLLKSAWDKKVFIKNEHEYKMAAVRRVPLCVTRLYEFYEKNICIKEIETMEKALFALIHSLENGYKLELPFAEEIH